MALTCPTNPDSNIINADINISASAAIVAALGLCVDAYIDVQLAAMAELAIDGISLDLLLPDTGDIPIPPCLSNSQTGPNANLHPLPIYTTRNITPILVTTVLPTTVVPLNPLSAVSPTIPPTLPFTSIPPTPQPTIPPTIIPNPSNPAATTVPPGGTQFPPGDPCNVNPCNFLNF